MPDEEKAARFTGTEVMLITAGVELLKSLIIMLANKLEDSDTSDIEAMEGVLESMKLAIELEKKIQEAQNEVENEDVNLDNWIDDSND